LKLTTETTLKALAWIGVVVWCVAPLAYLAGESALNALKGLPVQSAGRFGSSSPDLLAGMGFLAVFCYGVWCACGVVCAIGACRAVEAWGDAFIGLKAKWLAR
jgi:hypothetical protein